MCCRVFCFVACTPSCFNTAACKLSSVHVEEDCRAGNLIPLCNQHAAYDCTALAYWHCVQQCFGDLKCVCAPAERSKACIGGKSNCLLLLLLLTECHGHCGMRILMLHPDGFKLNVCLSVVACIGGHCCGPNLIAAAGPSALGCTGMCASACAALICGS